MRNQFLPTGQSAKARPPRKRQQAMIKMIEFVRPGGYWPTPYTLEQAFQVLRLMVKTGAAYSNPTRWGRAGVVEMLDGHGCVNCSGIRAITSIGDLHHRLQLGILDNYSPTIDRWRQEQGFEVMSETRCEFPHYAPYRQFLDGAVVSPATVHKAIDEFFTGFLGKTLEVSLNYVHLDARTVKQTYVAIRPDHFSFGLTFSLDGSVWDYELARTMPGETFLGTFSRAHFRLRLMLGMIVPPGQPFLDLLISGTAQNRHEEIWIAGHRPIKCSHFGVKDEIPAYYVHGPLGYGRSHIGLVHVASGTVLLTDRTFDYPRMHALAAKLKALAPHGGAPDAEKARHVYETETVPIKPLYDEHGNTIEAAAA